MNSVFRAIRTNAQTMREQPCAGIIAAAERQERERVTTARELIEQEIKKDYDGYVMAGSGMWQAAAERVVEQLIGERDGAFAGRDAAYREYEVQKKRVEELERELKSCSECAAFGNRPERERYRDRLDRMVADMLYPDKTANGSWLYPEADRVVNAAKEYLAAIDKEVDK